METSIVISLNPMEAMHPERIALDDDRDEAVRLIENILVKKVREASRPH